MRPTVTQYAQALEELASDTSVRPVALVQYFSEYLKRHGEMKKLPLVVRELEVRAKRALGLLTVKIITAHEVDETSRTRLLKKAEILFPGKKIEAEFVVDSSVMGGARFETVEQSYDATVRGELGIMKKLISH